MALVVEQLILGRAPVDVVVLFRPAIEDAGVAHGREPPIESEVEVGVFVGGDDVVRPDGFGERSVLDVPRRRNALRLVAAPPVRRGPVEGKLPPGGALGLLGLLRVYRGNEPAGVVGTEALEQLLAADFSIR